MVHHIIEKKKEILSCFNLDFVSCYFDFIGYLVLGAVPKYLAVVDLIDITYG